MATTPERKRLIDSKPVAGPSCSSANVVEAFPLVITPGGSIRVEQKGTNYELTGSGQLKAWRPDLVDVAVSSDEDMPVPLKKQKKSSKRLSYKHKSPKLSSKKLVDSEIEAILNLNDSASEEEMEEGFVDFDNEDENIMTRQILEEESCQIIEGNYAILNRYKKYEKEKWLSIEMQVEEVDGGGSGHLEEVEVQEEHIVEELVEVDGGGSSQMEEVELQVERTVEKLVVMDGGGSDQLEEVEVVRLIEEQVEHVGEVCEFEWKRDFESFNAKKEIYGRQSGPTIPSTCPYELFTAVWDENIINVIVEETNKYAWQVIAALSESEVGISGNSRLMTWNETNKHEMYTFLSICIYMTLCYRARLDEYWTTNKLEMPAFRSIMSRDRFLILLRFIHFIDNEISTHTLTSYEKKVNKITPIIDHCNNKFQELYVPKQYLSLDESLLLWKGRLSWVQCIRTKAARFGIKSFDLCEGDTGYLLKTLLYAGKNSSGMDPVISGFKNQRAKIVLKLTEGYLDLGHVLVMDNWYNQLSLTRYLKNRHTDVLGTLNRRRKGVPQHIQSLTERSMPRGHIEASHCGDMSIVAWKDVKLMTMLSTYHKNETYRGQRAGQAISKPIAVRDYTKYMGGVDLKDQRLSMYPMERKRATKWYMKVFRRMVNTSVMNIFIIYQNNHRAQGLDREMTHRQFRYAVADLLAHRHKQDLPEPTSRQLDLNNMPHRIDRGPHSIVVNEKLQQVSRDGYARKQRRRCARCSAVGRMKLVTTQCSRCNVGLCIGRCFQEYHTLEELNPPVQR